MNFKLWIETNEIILPKLFEKIKKLKGTYSGVHFSMEPQISHHTNPSHSDPIGVYVFPKKYVLEGKLEKNKMFSNYYYAFLIQANSNAKILNLDMNKEKAKSLLEKMGINKDLYDSKEIYHNSNYNTPGHRFWGALEHIRNKNNLSKNVSWNVLFSKTNYNTLYDPGLGVIHYNEPNQLLFLDHKAYDVVDVIRNTNPYNLILSFASFFPDFSIRKKRVYNPTQIPGTNLKRDKTQNVLLKKKNIEIVLRSSDNDNNLHVTVYGFINPNPSSQYSFDSKEWRKDIQSKQDFLDLVDEIKNYMNSSEVSPARNSEYDDSEKYEKMFKIANYYKLKIDPKYPGIIQKKYKNKTGFKLHYSPSTNDLSLGISKYNDTRSWNRYYYYGNVQATDDIEKDFKDLIEQIKTMIKEDMKDENSLKKYDAPYALNFIEFLENRTFKKRK